MIPKKIHYCWFGRGEMPAIAKKCIESWSKILPDYEIIRWDETNFDINATPFTKRAYEDKKYAFVSDYVRLYALAEFGGIYMDVDEIILKDFTSIIDGKELVACFETEKSVMVGFLATIPKYKIIQDFLEIYDKWNINVENVEYIANPKIFTKLLEKYGLELNGTMQSLDEGKIVIYPNEYFCGYDFSVNKEKITNNTYGIQKYAGTWTSAAERWNKKMRELLVNVIGEKNYLKLKVVVRKVKKK